MRRSRRWRGGRAPVLAIEKATADRHGFVGDELLSEDGSEEQAVVAATPVKQARAYPLNEQMLGRIRPKPMHEDNEVAFFLFSSLCYVLLWRCGGSGGGGSDQDFDVWGGMNGGAGQDTGAIFVPVDTGHHGEFGTTSPNGGLQQWVSEYFGLVMES